MQFPSFQSITKVKIKHCNNNVCKYLIKINKKHNNFKCMKYNPFNFGYKKIKYKVYHKFHKL